MLIYGFKGIEVDIVEMVSCVDWFSFEFVWCFVDSVKKFWNMSVGMFKFLIKLISSDDEF